MSKRSDVCEGCIKETLENILGSKSKKFLLVQSSRKRGTTRLHKHFDLFYSHKSRFSDTSAAQATCALLY